MEDRFSQMSRAGNCADDWHCDWVHKVKGGAQTQIVENGLSTYELAVRQCRYGKKTHYPSNFPKNYQMEEKV